MTKNELQPLPNTKTKHLRQLFNQPKPSGGLPKVSECKSEKSKIWPSWIITASTVTRNTSEVVEYDVKSPIIEQCHLPLLPASLQKWLQVQSSTPKLNYNSFHCYPHHLRSGWIWRTEPTPTTSEPGYALGGTSSPVLFEHVSREDDVTTFTLNYPVSRASRRVFPLLKCWQILKSGVARTAAATPYGTFIRPRECLGMLQEWRARPEDSETGVKSSIPTPGGRSSTGWRLGKSEAKPS